MDQWAGRKNEPHDQGRDCQTLLLRDPRPTASPPAKLRRRLQLRQAAQNPQGPHPIRIHLQSLDFRATPIQNQPAPANAGTKHLACRREADPAVASEEPIARSCEASPQPRGPSLLRVDRSSHFTFELDVIVRTKKWPLQYRCYLLRDRVPAFAGACGQRAWPKRR